MSTPPHAQPGRHGDGGRRRRARPGVRGVVIRGTVGSSPLRGRLPPRGAAARVVAGLTSSRCACALATGAPCLFISEWLCGGTFLGAGALSCVCSAGFSSAAVAAQGAISPGGLLLPAAYRQYGQCRGLYWQPSHAHQDDEASKGASHGEDRADVDAGRGPDARILRNPTVQANKWFPARDPRLSRGAPARSRDQCSAAAIRRRYLLTRSPSLPKRWNTCSIVLRPASSSKLRSRRMISSNCSNAAS